MDCIKIRPGKYFKLVYDSSELPHANVVAQLVDPDPGSHHITVEAGVELVDVDSVAVLATSCSAERNTDYPTAELVAKVGYKISLFGVPGKSVDGRSVSLDVLVVVLHLPNKLQLEAGIEGAVDQPGSGHLHHSTQPLLGGGVGASELTEQGVIVSHVGLQNYSPRHGAARSQVVLG